MALLSRDYLTEATRIKQQVCYLELADQSGFQDAFLGNLNF